MNEKQMQKLFEIDDLIYEDMELKGLDPDLDHPEYQHISRHARKLVKAGVKKKLIYEIVADLLDLRPPTQSVTLVKFD